MKVHVFITIKGKIDSRSLWKLIERHKINLTTDDEEVTWVYGDVDLTAVGDIALKCALFGNIEANIKR